MTNLVLNAQKREKLGTSDSRKIRNNNGIPAVVYSKEGNINCYLGTKEFEHEYFKGGIQSRIIELKIGDKVTKVTTKTVDLDPISDRPAHVEFLKCQSADQIKVATKLNFVNKEKSPGIKKGGLLHVVLRRVNLVCSDENSVPQALDIDIGALHIGQKITTANLALPTGSKINGKPGALIASIVGRGKSDDDAASKAAAAAAPTAAAPAAAAKGAPAAKAPAAKK